MIDRASALVRAGSVLSFPDHDRVVIVRVEGLAERRGPYEEARHLYTDLTRELAAVRAAPLTTGAAAF